MTDWNPESPSAWARVLGMVYIPMFGSSRAQKHPGECAVLLDGDKASFALTVGDADHMLKGIEPLDWSWSSNLTHTLIVDKPKSKLFIRRWDDPENPKERPLPTSQQAPEILDLLAASGLPNKETVIDRMTTFFRGVRSSVEGDLGGTPTDVVEAFNALLVLTDAARRDLVSPQEWADALTLHDVLHLIERKRLTAPGLLKASPPVRKLQTKLLMEELFERDPATKYLLEPDLLIRHAAGALNQEAHRELGRPPIRQKPLFPILDTSPPKGAAKSDAHFTPVPLARTLVEQAFVALSAQTVPPRIEVLDPACGSGVFLIEALRELCFGWGHGLSLRGFDNSPVAQAMTEFCLRRAVEDAPSEKDKVTVEIKEQDSLAPGSSWGSPDLILMNPPFAPWQRMSPQERDRVREVLGDWYFYRADKALAFIALAIRSLKPGAVLATLAPASLLDSASARKFRLAVESDGTLAIHLIGHFRGFEYFRGATVAPAFLVISRRADASAHRPQIQVALAEKDYEEEAIRALRNNPKEAREPGKWEVFQANPADYSAANWMPQPSLATQVAALLFRKGTPCVGDLFHVGFSLRTGNNKVFLLSSAELEALHPSDGERKMFRPVAHNRTIRDGRILPGLFVFYPYSREGKSLFQTEQEAERAAPRFYQSRLAPNRESLAGRNLGDRHWWELVRHRTWQAPRKPKIVSALFGQRGRFAYDDSGVYCVMQATGWLWKRPGFHKTDLPWAYLALLNSSFFERLVGQFCRQMRGGQFEMYPRPVKKVFLPDLSDERRVPKEVFNGLASFGQSTAQGHGPALGALGSLDELERLVAAAYGIPLATFRVEGGGQPGGPAGEPPPKSHESADGTTAEKQQSGDANARDMEKVFRALVKRWKKDTEASSSILRMVKHPAYQEIMGMGEQVVPLLLAELKREPDFWFAALEKLTGANPAPKESAGKIKQIAKAWLDWGRQKGLVQ
jgi:adenine-specific DNA-methyltransferase